MFGSLSQADMFVSVCPICISKSTRKPVSAGHKPILTRGFGTATTADAVANGSVGPLCVDRGSGLSTVASGVNVNGVRVTVPNSLVSNGPPPSGHVSKFSIVTDRILFGHRSRTSIRGGASECAPALRPNAL